MQFRDLQKQYQALSAQINQAIGQVCRDANFISGRQVKALEQELAEYVGVEHCITCANGTDAITLALKAWEIGPGDAVFVPDFTFFSTGECPACEGAAVVFVDVDPRTYNMDPAKLENAVQRVIREERYTPKAVIAVDLFGQPADYPRIISICRKYGLYLLEDGAQGFGGSIGGESACSFGDISTTSFFPAKPLGCYGDGGAVFTRRQDWAERIRSLAVHGKNGADKYDNMRLGMNSRLDTLQAAVLQVKLKTFRDTELDAVNRAAERYTQALSGTGLILPRVKEGFGSGWAQYTVRLPREVDRDAFQMGLKEKGIPTMVYYKKPMHLQGAFSETDSALAECPVTGELCERVLSLPIHPYLTDGEIDFVAASVAELLQR